MTLAAGPAPHFDYTRRERNRDRAWIRMFAVEAWIDQGGKCAYCRQPIPRAAVTGDHADALSRGGVTRRDNIKAACRDCNLTKGPLSEGLFLKLIKSPKPGDSIFIWLAWSRRRIWLRVERAAKRIMEAAK